MLTRTPDTATAVDGATDRDVALAEAMLKANLCETVEDALADIRKARGGVSLVTTFGAPTGLSASVAVLDGRPTKIWAAQAFRRTLETTSTSRTPLRSSLPRPLRAARARRRASSSGRRQTASRAGPSSDADPPAPPARRTPDLAAVPLDSGVVIVEVRWTA